MCGREAQLVKARIEGTELEVCQECTKFGEVIEKPDIKTKTIPIGRPSRPIPKRKEIIQVILPDYAQKIRQAREKMGLKQEEFAKKLNEKASIMQKIESGQFKPSIDMARKLERRLGIRLVDQYDEGGEIPIASPKRKEEGFTMADFIKDKRKKT